MKSSTKGKEKSYDSQSVGHFQHHFPETSLLCKDLTISKLTRHRCNWVVSLVELWMVPNILPRYIFIFPSWASAGFENSLAEEKRLNAINIKNLFIWKDICSFKGEKKKKVGYFKMLAVMDDLNFKRSEKWDL